MIFLKNGEVCMRIIMTALMALLFSTAVFADAVLVKETQKRAAKGEAEYQYDLGMMYIKGRDLKQDTAEGLKWLKLAAAQKNADACYQLGRMYNEGETVEKNDAESIKWFILAGEAGSGEAQQALGTAYKDGTDGAKKDLKEAAKWFEKSYESLGNRGDLSSLADVYTEMKDYPKLIGAYKKMMEGWEPEIHAAPKLADLYYTGKGTKVDYEEAYYYWAISSLARIPVDKKFSFEGKIKKEKKAEIEARAEEFVHKYEMNMGKGG